jgi:putative peptide zinc metalloprotease protein
VALVAGLAWAWWPAGDRYRPVHAWEGGTVLDAVPASDGQALAEGSRGTAATLWPADAAPVPTVEQPALALVLVPRSDGEAGAGPEAADGDAPTWVFPFDRPPPPGDGDNQALAVNTEDGSVRYDVSFALVWADEGAAVNRNEAYALASCRDCTTVAVAFQVVLLVGSVDVVVPENIAAAVNYACVECVTYALATQLVVTLPGSLGDDGARELAAIWAELQAFGEQIDGLPLADLRNRLTEFEQRILTVVREDSATQDAEPPEGTGPTGAGGSGAASTAAPATDGDDVPTRTDSGARTSTGSATAPSGATAEPTSGAGATGSATATSAPAATTSPAGGSTGSTTASSPTG